jgi:hypothetical protein
MYVCTHIVIGEGSIPSAETKHRLRDRLATEEALIAAAAALPPW